MLSSFVRFVRPTLGLGLALLIMMLASELRGYAQTACSQKDLRQALIGQNVVTEGVLKNGTALVIGSHARLVIAGARVQENTLFLSLTPRIVQPGMGQPLVASFQFSPIGCDPIAIRSQLSDLLVFPSEEASTVGTHVQATTQAGQNATVNANIQPVPSGYYSMSRPSLPDPNMRPSRPLSQVASESKAETDAQLSPDERERAACCDSEAAVIRFCEAHVLMTPDHYATGSLYPDTNTQPCMRTLIAAGESQGNPWGISVQVMAQAYEAAREADLRYELESARKAEEQAKQLAEIQAQDAARKAQEQKQRLEAIQNAIRNGPPPGATIYHGLYIGEPIAAIRPPALSCLSGSYGADEAQIKMIKNHAAEACFLIGGWSVDKIVDLIAGPTDVEMQLLENQYGSPLPGKRRLLDGEAYPEWYIWPERKDGIFIAAKRDSGSVQNENPVFFTSVVILKR
jgi:hypothetical protein